MHFDTEWLKIRIDCVTYKNLNAFLFEIGQKIKVCYIL
jgi:hypothetical protein